VSGNPPESAKEKGGMLEKSGMIAMSVPFLTKLSLGCCLGGVFCLGTAFVLAKFPLLDYLFQFGWTLLAGSVLFGTLDFILAFLMGVKLSGRDKVHLGVSVGLSGLLFLLLFLAALHVRYRLWWEENFTPDRNIRVVGKPLVRYASRNQGYLPNADHWCDILMNHDPNLTKNDFKNPNRPDAECGFAFNKNLSGMALTGVPRDAILLFEVSGPWNLSGEGELLETSQSKAKYIKMLFADLSLHSYWFYANGVRSKNSYEHKQVRWKP
jgi:hypothetical protein